MKEPVITAAQYAGAISHWCDLHGKTPVVAPKESKLVAEFEAFSRNLSDTAARKSLHPGLSRPPTRPPMRRSP